MSNCNRILLVFFIASPSSHMFEGCVPRCLDGGSKSKVGTRVDNRGGIGAYTYEITEQLIAVGEKTNS